MELADSKPERTRSGLGIDLNEIPSSSSYETLSSEAFDFVRAYHDHPTPPAGAPAEVPGGSLGSSCGACGRPEAVEHTVVCDGCERGFHLGCAGLLGREVVALDEWLCGECVSNGLSSSRWPLGSKSSGQKRRIMDINASPGGEDEGTGELPDLRKHTPDDNSFGGNPFGAPVTYSNLYTGNEFGLQKESGIETHTAKLSFEDILQHSLTEGRSSEEVDMHSLLGRFRSNNDRNINLPPQHLSKMYLQALAEFVFERNGVLEEGWHVEFRTSISSGELHAVYCAPDGKIFESVPEVACYLGLTSNRNSVEPEVRSNGSASLQRRLHLPKIRKSAGLSMANGVTKNNGTSLTGLCEVLPYDFQIAGHASEHGNNVKVMEVMPEENSSIGPQQLNDGLPVQYEDFFVLSLGKIDTRLSYHNFNQIWPVGYRSCWHDKITGSLFMCDVLDGGNSGPIFKVRRCSCAALSIPDASSVLYRPKCCQNKEENEEMTSVNMDYDEDCIVQMILSDPSPPVEHDILSCLGSCFDESFNVQTSNCLWLEAGSHCERFGNLLSDNLVLSDDIGDFSVEESSSSSAWRMMSKKFIETCREFYVNRGNLKFFCKHVENRTCSAYWDVSDGSNEEKFTSLAKLCGSSCSATIPSVIQDKNKLETEFEALVKWLDQDRFGLDVEFVQQIVERLPGILACSQYVLLKERSNSSSVTVGNGLLLANTKGGVQASDQEALDGLFRGSKQSSMQVVEDPVMKKHCIPPGKPISSRLPHQLIGDVLQVWEFLLRFFEFLGLREPSSFEELEKELISPWSDGSYPQEKLGGKFHGNQDIFHRTDGTGGHILSSRNESGSAVPVEGPREFIQIEMGVMKEVAQARMASVCFSKCMGFTLTKAQCSLLKVLISELMSKVAAIVDPNFDTGEPKSKRGKKKDTDCSTAAKRTKVNMLPINELTWPELARRYVLAILSMDGNFDSAEVTMSESSKVFHCLQGDGGVLCGSLTGVVGMEADAVLLAEATKKIFGSLNRDNDILTIDDGGSDGTGAFESSTVNDNIPEWAQLLEPVRKLPTNVGARIRRCINDALEKGPPEWAKKILEHSISKEVYKGNASGPTKKAVISVLADVYGEGVRLKPDRERKRKIHISISDIIMKQCRIVLRRAAAADDAKVFCNLLGRKLISSNDNDDEGILGPPAMVSRPLDFRTIDLRLAAGAYDGSHKAFLEDVRELWTNICIAHCDRPDMVQLAETLLNNFESLYEKEVVSLFQKLVDYAKSKCLSADSKKEINDFLVPASELPKAPWEEGVCKICGIDKDDDSVLLCDTCDAEYHTYCLNPPLARIPKGNWYCPSCVAGKHLVQDALECTSIICEDRKKKHGEVSCYYLDALTHLVVVMKEREYWEFNVDERIFLLNILCDELLNTTVIRQHLEHCAKESADLQQKLRSMFVEWKNLKHKEEILAAEVAIIGRNFSNAVGDVGKEGLATLTNNGKCSGRQHVLNDRPDCSNAFSEDVAQLKGGKKGNGSIVSNKYPSGYNFEKKCSDNSQVTDCMDVEDKFKDVQPLVSGSHLLASNLLQQETTDLNIENSFHCDKQKYVAMDVDTLGSSEDLHGNCLHLDTESSHIIEHVAPMVMNDSHANSLELISVGNEISLLQDSITSIKKQLLKLSLRRVFLGSDSAGRLYWVLAKLDSHPWVIISGSMAEQQGQKMTHLQTTENCSVMRNSAPYDMDVLLTPRGSGASCPSTHEFNDASSSFSPWVFYQSDAEIKELVECLKDNDPQERELKESILHWQKVGFQDIPRSGSENQNGLQIDSENSRISERSVSSKHLVTKAARFLETKYGPCFEPEAIDFLKKRGRKAKFATEEKMYRCECLEPVWPSRHHCVSCHRTFFTDEELEGHDNAKCNAGAPVYEKRKEKSASKGKGIMKSENAPEECIGEIDVVEASKSGCSGFSSSLIKYQNDGLVCPYDFEDICSKFLIKSINKELVQEIGLIGSNGIPSFLPSVSPYLSDSTLMLIPPKRDLRVADDELEADERLNSIQGNKMATNEGHGNISDNFPITCAANDCSEALEKEKPTFGCLQQKDNRMSSCGHASVIEVTNCCIVPESSLRPLIGKTSQILKQLKINLLDMDAALPDAALRPSKAHLERRWAWRAFVKSAETIYEMVQSVIIFENMIKAEYLRNFWWYWSSLSAAAKISTLSSLALRIYSLDAAINYENVCSNLDPLDPSSRLDQSPQPGLDATEKSKFSRKTNKKRKEAEG